jgi:hypothetical protein
MELFTRQLSGTQNLEVANGLMVNLWSPQYLKSYDKFETSVFLPHIGYDIKGSRNCEKVEYGFSEREYCSSVDSYNTLGGICHTCQGT